MKFLKILRKKKLWCKN